VSHQTITFLLLAAVVVVFILDRFPVAVVAVATALALWATGVLDLNQALAGFGDPAVLFIASLFVVSESLDATGVTAWAGQMLIARVGESRTRLLVLMMLLVALLTALISVDGAVAALLPVMVVTAARLRRPTAQLLLPLAFAARGHAGEPDGDGARRLSLRRLLEGRAAAPRAVRARRRPPRARLLAVLR
jgi:Na+/H+ antiporter NhaD/arsenite permease-like protein